MEEYYEDYLELLPDEELDFDAASRERLPVDEELECVAVMWVDRYYMEET